MTYNLFVAYDLMSPGQNYERVIAAIKSLGPHWQFQFSLFYVSSAYDPKAAFDIVGAAMDGNDRLAVINASYEVGAIVTNWDHPPLDAINSIWSAP